MKGVVVRIVKGRAGGEEWQRLTVVVEVEQRTLIDWKEWREAWWKGGRTVESQMKVRARFGWSGRWALRRMLRCEDGWMILCHQILRQVATSFLAHSSKIFRNPALKR